MNKVAICICTKHRYEGLEKLLLSLYGMQVPTGTKVEIIIVENDDEKYSEHIVNKFQSHEGLKISYFLETKPGLVYARNRSIKEAGNCDFYCFVDDDQVVDRMWLTELVNCQIEFNADGVWGINPPIFNEEVPTYIKQFHTPKRFGYGEVVSIAFTNCLMLKKEYLDRIDGPFDIRLNFTGGEDRLLTYKISKAGGKIICNPNAKAYEIIPKNRTTIKYVIIRTYRIMNTGLYVKRLEDPDFSIWQILPRLIMRFCWGLLIFIPFLIFGKSNKLKGLIKMINAIGGFAFILGFKYEFYR